MLRRYIIIFTLTFLSACAHSTQSVGSQPTPPATHDPFTAAQKAVNSEGRSEADRALDARRKPAETLAFFGIAPGMRVAEIGAGGGYTTELLARIVGESGTVYGQNSQFILDRFAEKPWSERLAKPINAKVVRLNTNFDSPFSDGFVDNGKLDAVVNILFYHDTVWLPVNRAAMNRAIFAALKPGGIYGIVDHSAKPTDGLNVTQTLHRIDEAAVIKEISAAGFVLDGTADFLRNPEDTRDWNASPKVAAERRGTSDRFVLRFRKPQ